MAEQASSQTVDLLRRFYESFNQRDIDAVLEVCSEQVEVYKDPEVVDMVASSTPRGQDHVAQYLRGWLDSWTDYNARPQEFVQSGDRRCERRIGYDYAGRGRIRRCFLYSADMQHWIPSAPAHLSRERR